MTIRVHESMAGKVVSFEPRSQERVAMYGCGPTVYNYIHIGNARTFAWYDLIRRYLVYRGFDVTYVMNYTDVDDKIIERAKVEGLTADAIARKYAQAYEEDMAAFNVVPADLLVRATEHVDDMVKAIAGLIERDVAYESEGDVYFAVERFPDYGKLSHRSLEDMRAGERVEIAEHKRNPLDFTLWKAAKEGEPSWPSPWGPGRPGWHIECSVMSTKYLGGTLDIHVGGRDLIFPHHENEVAQAEGLSGEPFVRFWLHTGLVQMESAKMSKSLGNVVLARDVLEQVPGEVARYWAVSSAYRSQQVFSEEALYDAGEGYDRWRTFYESARHALGDDVPARREDISRPVDGSLPEGVAGRYVARFIEEMDDDFNSAGAFAALHDLVREGNRRLPGAQHGDGNDRDELAALFDAFIELTTVLNFEFAQKGDTELVSGLVEYLLELREQARAEKAFERADGIRARLGELGVAVEDTPAGPRWRLGSAD